MLQGFSGGIACSPGSRWDCPNGDGLPPCGSVAEKHAATKRLAWLFFCLGHNRDRGVDHHVEPSSGFIARVDHLFVLCINHYW